MMYPYWGLIIAAELLITTYRWGELCKLYNSRDLPILLYGLHHITHTATIAYERTRVGRAVFLVKKNSKKTAFWTRSEKEVTSLYEKEVRTFDERRLIGLCSILRANLDVVKLMRHWGTLDDGAARFFNEEGLFNDRTTLITRTAHFEELCYEDFARDFAVDDAMEEPLILDTEKHFTAGKSELLAWVKATGKKDDQLVRDGLGSALAGLQLLKQLNKTKKFCLKNPGKVLFPVFAVSAK
jgi:hypothetical protein